MNKILYIVVPCYNEEEVLSYTAKQLQKKLETLIKEDVIDCKSRILFVDDGSKDKTWEIISDYAKNNPQCFSGLKFAHNAGHQNALVAGMEFAVDVSDVIITIDADLQQDINAIDSFMQSYAEGYDIVYGVRNNRGADGVFKKMTALAFYKFMNALGGNVKKNHADYRLLSKRVTEALLQFDERDLFLRGIVPMIGFKSKDVYFDVQERKHGESKYTVGKMFSFALDGIVSLSTRPIHFISMIGAVVIGFCALNLLWSLLAWLFGETVQGWTTLSIATFFLSGVQLLSLGVVGEYVAKIYTETKHRPRYIIESKIDSNMAMKDE